MEWGDAKPPPQWNWDGLAAALDPRSVIQPPPPLEFWDVEGGSLDSPDGLGRGCSSRSSISADTASAKDPARGPPRGEEKESSGDSLEAVVSVCSGSGGPPVGLKLGKRTYFDDLSVGSEAKSPGVLPVPARSASVPVKKRARAPQHGPQVVWCQVEGCNLDLTGAKEYHKKHRVCASHSKSPRVVVSGREKRFCQQCSRLISVPW